MSIEAQIVAAKLTGQIQVKICWGYAQESNTMFFPPDETRSYTATVRHNGHAWVIEVPNDKFREMNISLSDNYGVHAGIKPFDRWLIAGYRSSNYYVPLEWYE